MKLHGVTADAAQFRNATVRKAMPHQIDNRPLGRRQHIRMSRSSPTTYSHGGMVANRTANFPTPPRASAASEVGWEAGIRSHSQQAEKKANREAAEDEPTSRRPSG